MLTLVFLLLIMVGFALWAIFTNLLLRAAIALALTSATLTIIMFRLDAPYAGAFELSVCAGLIPVIFISVISLLQRIPLPEQIERRQKRLKRFWYLPLVLLAIGWLFYAIKPVPGNFIRPEIINDVRVVLWDQRRLDLFGQILALLAGAYGVTILFKENKNNDH
jgi:NADH-quinone oxidoreductase subunit J